MVPRIYFRNILSQIFESNQWNASDLNGIKSYNQLRIDSPSSHRLIGSNSGIIETTIAMSVPLILQSLHKHATSSVSLPGNFKESTNQIKQIELEQPNQYKLP